MAYDVLIRGGRVLDGSGAPWALADVAIRGGRLARIGHLPRARARIELDARGRYVAPGFIDIHTHSDLGLLLDPSAECAVRQGATTHVIGNCGDSAAPVAAGQRELLARRLSFYGAGLDLDWTTFAQYLARLEERGVGINVAALVGHSTVRIAALGMAQVAPSAAQLRRMQAEVRAAMVAGAFGLSTGLVYPPGCFADTAELVALARVVARHGGLYASHIRGERETIAAAVAECIAIGEAAGCRVQISHNNPKLGAWGRTAEVQALWEAARERGVDVTADNDVHTDFGPPLRAALPQWTQALSHAQLAATLADPARRAAIRAEIVADRTPAFGPVGLLIHGRWERIWILHSQRHPAYVGQTLAALATARQAHGTEGRGSGGGAEQHPGGVDPWDLFFDLIAEEGDQVVGLFDYQDPADIEATIRHPLTMLCSDGWVQPVRPSDAGPGSRLDGPESALAPPPPYLPCAYGEFPGILERLVVQRRVLRLEEAVRKLTSMPAAKLGLQDRGLLREGLAADVVVFDLARVRDNATSLFPHDDLARVYPHRWPEGIEHVLINGQLAVQDGQCLRRQPGRVLRRRS